MRPSPPPRDQASRNENQGNSDAYPRKVTQPRRRPRVSNGQGQSRYNSRQKSRVPRSDSEDSEDEIRYLFRPSPLACWPYYYRTVLVVFHAVFCSPEDPTHRGTDSKMPSWPTGNTRGNSRKKSAVYRVVNTMHNVTYSFRST